MVTKKDFIGVGIISLTLALTGFILDLNERVPDIATNISETLMMAFIIYAIISFFYFPIKVLTGNSARQRSKPAGR